MFPLTWILQPIISRQKWGSGQVSFPTRQGRKYSEDEPLVGSESGHEDCCPPVVDTKTLLTMLAFLAAATYFLYVDITMNIMGPFTMTWLCFWDRLHSKKLSHLQQFFVILRNTLAKL